MKNFRTVAKSAALGLFATTMVAGTLSAGPLTSSLDQFVVIKNGSVYVNDTFSDGVVPPSSESNFGTGSTSVTYRSRGGFNETGGKLVMDSAKGAPVFNTLVNATTGTTIFAPTQLLRLHQGTVRSNTQPVSTSTSGLKDDDTFSVLGLFDLDNLPPVRSDNFGVGLVDGSGTDDRLRLSVVRTSLSDSVRVSFWRNNQSTDPDQNERFGSDAFAGGHDQILLRLSRDVASSDIITASYAYVDGANIGMDISNAANVNALSFNTINTGSPVQNPLGFTPDIFNGETYTRAQFRQLVRDEDNRFDFARLTTGSPVEISQTVDTGVSPSYLTFNYLFETSTGELKVSLGGVELGVIGPPASLSNNFETASFLVDDPGLLGQTGLLLKFLFDGPTGSQILLDSIAFENLQNGNFATGDLFAWNVAASPGGGAGVLTVVAQVPEPGTLIIFGLGLAGLCFARRRKAA